MEDASLSDANGIVDIEILSIGNPKPNLETTENEYSSA